MRRRSATTSEPPLSHSFDYFPQIKVRSSFLFSHAAQFRELEATVMVPLLGLGGCNHNNLMGKSWTFIQEQCHVGILDHCSQRKEGRKQATLEGRWYNSWLGQLERYNGAMTIITRHWLKSHEGDALERHCGAKSEKTFVHPYSTENVSEGRMNKRALISDGGVNMRYERGGSTGSLGKTDNCRLRCGPLTCRPAHPQLRGLSWWAQRLLWQQEAEDWRLVFALSRTYAVESQPNVSSQEKQQSRSMVACGFLSNMLCLSKTHSADSHDKR